MSAVISAYVHYMLASLFAYAFVAIHEYNFLIFSLLLQIFDYLDLFPPYLC